MGRTISGYKSNRKEEIIDLKKSKKANTKRKNKNISKWGKGHISKDKIQVDTFELQSPRSQMHPTEVLWE